MADNETIGKASIELGIDSSKVASQGQAGVAAIGAVLSKAEREQAKATRAMQQNIDRINATKASASMAILESAVTKMGGAASLNATQVQNLSREVERLRTAGAAVPASLEKIGATVTTTGSKYGQLADTVGRTSSTLARSADSFGLAAGPLRALDDVADVAEIGLMGMSRAALTASVSFKTMHLAMLGPIAAAAAVGAAIGTLLNKLEPVRKAADAVTGTLLRLATSQEELDRQHNATVGISEDQKRNAAVFLEVQKGIVERARAAGVSAKELAEQYKHHTPELQKQLGINVKIAETIDKQAAAAKRFADSQKEMAGPAGADIQGADLLRTWTRDGKPMDFSKLMVIPAKAVADVKAINIEMGEVTKKTFNWTGLLQGIALLAGTIGEKFSAVVGVIGNIGDAFRNAKTGAEKFNAIAGAAGQVGGIIGGRGGRALQGAAGGAMAGFSLGGPAAIPAAIIGGVAGGLIGLFRKPAWEKASKEAAKILGHDVPQAMAEQIMAEAKASGKSIKQVAEKMKADAAREAAIAKRQQVEEGLGRFTSGFETAQSALRDSTRSPALDAALAQIGAALDAALGAAGLFRTPEALKDSKEFGAAQTAAGGLAEAAAGARQAGIVDASLQAALGVASTELRAQATAAARAAGMGESEAQRAGFGAVASLLREQLNSQLQANGKVDAALQAQLDEAKANGIEILADPAIEHLNVAKETLAVLEEGLLHRVRERVEGARNTPAAGVPPGAGPPRIDPTGGIGGHLAGGGFAGRETAAILANLPPGAGGVTITNETHVQSSADPWVSRQQAEAGVIDTVLDRVETRDARFTQAILRMLRENGIGPR